MREVKKEIRQKTLLAQHDQLSTEMREISKAIWQVPSVVGVLNSLFLGVAITLKEELLLSLSMVSVALFLTFTFTVSLHKHRFFSEAKRSMRDDIETILRDEYGAIKIYYGTEEIHSAIETGKIEVSHKGWFTRQKAENWLFGGMYAMLALILIVAAWLFI